MTEVRPATAGDLPELAEVWEDAANAAFGPLLPQGSSLPAADQLPPRLRSVVADPSVLVLVAEEEGVVGCITAGASRDEGAPALEGEVRMLVVRPRAWGGGAGNELMRRALAWLAERGYGEAILWSFEANARANAFYERHGFRRDGGEKREPQWGDVLEVRYRRGV